MDEYRSDVERLARERTGEPFYNSSIDHAAVIVEKMFRHANSEVCIVTEQLNGRVFGKDEVVEELEGFLSTAGHRVRILIENDISTLSEGHPFLRALRYHPNGYEMRRLSPELRDDVDYHFTLADNDSYRFEPSKSEWVAVAAFGDKETATRLGDVFNALWAGSDDVTLPAAN